MNYESAVRYLSSLGRELGTPTQATAAKFNLENITVLVERLGRPERTYPIVHIAGTNGKGSTAAFLEAILRAAGFRTGLNTSPHLERINERIRINGEEVSDQIFAEAFTRVQEVIEELLASARLRAHPTYFECVTALAFEVFAREGVEFAVVEVGLGGRLDATNIVRPQVSVITRIDFDHENYLGHSLEEIAREKAGIVKAGVPVATAPQLPEVREVLRGKARELDATIVDTGEDFDLEREIAEAGCERTGEGRGGSAGARTAGKISVRERAERRCNGQVVTGARLPNHESEYRARHPKRRVARKTRKVAGGAGRLPRWGA